MKTRIGTIIMGEEVERLGGFRETSITGFGKEEVARGIYELITFVGATEALYNNIIDMLLVNDSDATIAKKHTIYPTWMLPGSIIRMMPLCGLPDRGPSLPPEESPATPIWAKIVNAIVEVGRTLWNLFVARISFIAELLEKVVEWGLELLGKIMEFIEQVAKMFSFVLKIIAEVVGYFFQIIVESVMAILSCFAPLQTIDGGFEIVFPTGFGLSMSLLVYVTRMDSGFGFDVPFLVVVLDISLMASGFSLFNMTFSIYLSSLYVGTSAEFDIDIRDLDFHSTKASTVCILEDIVALFAEREFLELFIPTLVSQFLGELTLLTCIQASSLATGSGLSGYALGVGLYSLGLFVWAYPYRSIPERNIECIAFSFASIPALVYGLCVCVGLLNWVRKGCPVMWGEHFEGIERYLNAVVLAEEYKRKLLKAFHYLGQ